MAVLSSWCAPTFSEWQVRVPAGAVTGGPVGRRAPRRVPGSVCAHLVLVQGFSAYLGVLHGPSNPKTLPVVACSFTERRTGPALLRRDRRARSHVRQRPRRTTGASGLTGLHARMRTVPPHTGPPAATRPQPYWKETKGMADVTAWVQLATSVVTLIAALLTVGDAGRSRRNRRRQAPGNRQRRRRVTARRRRQRRTR